MFDSFSLRGLRGSLLWGADDAATLGAWTAQRGKDRRAWTLRATVQRVDTYRIRQVPLLFQARQAQRPFGHWVFPVIPNSVQVTGTTVTARLGPPEG